MQNPQSTFFSANRLSALVSDLNHNPPSPLLAARWVIKGHVGSVLSYLSGGARFCLMFTDGLLPSLC